MLPDAVYSNMQYRQFHKPEVQAFLARHLGDVRWELTLPSGHGNETYFARSDRLRCFVKLNVQIARYQAMASLSLTPPVLSYGHLADGTTLIVQPFVDGRNPTRKDYRTHLERFARIINQTHHSSELQAVLPPRSSDRYRYVGMEWLANIRQRWEQQRALVPEVAKFVDESLDNLTRQVQSFEGGGLIASHNDICNGNWLVTPEGRLYLVDLEGMSLDDPAVDIGATLWWYYPPALRQQFLEIVGYARDEPFRLRMQVRMAMHCLHIILPRQGSFDAFNPMSFAEALNDFRAIFTGEENPQGYDDP